MKIRNADYDLILNDNKVLKEADIINRKFDSYKTIIAEVSSFSPNNFEKVYTINKGYEDGIREKMPVITSDGLVGYISKVSKNNSNITSIIDSSTSFSARNDRTKDLFVVSGSMNLMDKNEVMAKEIPFGSHFQSGDTVFTSGMGELYPKGITIGKITTVSDDINPVESIAIIKTNVDFNKLDLVAVIVKEENSK